MRFDNGIVCFKIKDFMLMSKIFYRYPIAFRLSIGNIQRETSFVIFEIGYAIRTFMECA